MGSVDGNGIFSSFYEPAALTCDEADNIYVWDSGNTLIRKINQNRDVFTIAGGDGSFSVGGPYVGSDIDGVGTNAGFYAIGGMCVDNLGNLILACPGKSSNGLVVTGSSIRKMTATASVVTLAGSFTQSGYTNGAGGLARFSGADGVCMIGGTIDVADSSNQRIRSITQNPTAQIVTGANLGIRTFTGVTITGIVGRTYQIQASPDLNTWSTIATVLLNRSPYLWIAQNPMNGNKFYRALLLP